MTEKNKKILEAVNALVSAVDDIEWSLPEQTDLRIKFDGKSTAEALRMAADQVTHVENCILASTNYKPCANGTIMHHASEILREIAQTEERRENALRDILTHAIDAETATAILDEETQVKTVSRLTHSLENAGFLVTYQEVESEAIVIASRLLGE